jgi:hypothetical protein
MTGLGVGYPGWAEGDGGLGLGVLLWASVALAALRLARGRVEPATWVAALVLGPVLVSLADAVGPLPVALAVAMLCGAMARARASPHRSH